MYLVKTRPDIFFDVNTLSQFMVEARRVHSVLVKHVLRDLRCMVDCGLSYVQGGGFKLMCYIDSVRQVVQMTRKTPQGATSTWDRQLCLGLARNRSQWH